MTNRLYPSLVYRILTILLLVIPWIWAHGDNAVDADRIMADSLCERGLFHCVDDLDYTEAFSCFSKAYDIACDRGYDDVRIRCAINLASLFLTYDNLIYTEQFTKEAMTLYREAFDLAASTHDWDKVSFAMLCMLNVSDGGDAQDIIDRCLKKYLSLPIPDTVPEAVFVKELAKGISYLDRDNCNKALDSFRKSLAMVSTPEWDFRTLVGVRIMTVRALARCGKYDEAFELCDRSAAEADSIGTPDLTAAIYAEKEKIAMMTGDDTSASALRLMRLEIKDSLLADTGIGNIASLHHEANSDKDRLSIVLIAGLLLGMALIAYIWIAVRRRHHKSISAVAAPQLVMEQEKYRGSNLTEVEKERIHTEIERVMKESEEILSESFSLQRLAELASTTPRRVSQVVNEKYGCNLKTLANRCRIQTAVARLRSSEYRNLTIEGIGISVGFKSRSYFVTAVKKATGRTPSEIRENPDADIVMDVPLHDC